MAQCSLSEIIQVSRSPEIPNWLEKTNAGECCNYVLLQSSLLDLKTPPEFPSAWPGVDNDLNFIFVVNGSFKMSTSAIACLAAIWPTCRGNANPPPSDQKVTSYTWWSMIHTVYMLIWYVQSKGICGLQKRIVTTFDSGDWAAELVGFTLIPTEWELTLVCHMSACFGLKSGICIPSRDAKAST